MRRALVAVGLLLAGCGGPAATPVGTPAVTIQLSASNLHFDLASFTVPADLTFAVELDNREVAPHNVVIRGNGITRETEPFSGPATRTYVYAAIPAGNYTFVCTVHPEMQGTVTSAPATGAAP